MKKRLVKSYLTHPDVGERYPEYDGKPVEVISAGQNRMAVRRPGAVLCSEFNLRGHDDGREWHRDIEPVSIVRTWIELAMAQTRRSEP